MFGRDTRYVVAFASQALGAIFVTPLMTRVLGPSQFGIYAANLALLWVFIWVFNLGLNLGATRIYAEADGARKSRNVLAASLVIVVVLDLLALATGPEWCTLLGFRDFAVAEKLTVVWAGLAAATVVTMALLRCADRFLVFAVVTVSQSLGAFIVGLTVAAFTDHTATNVLTGTVSFQAVALIFGLSFVRPRWDGMESLRLLARTLRFSLPLVPQQIGTFVINSSDRFIVLRDLGSTATGRYQVAYNVGSQAITLLGFLNQAWLPRIFAMRDASMRQRVLADSRDGLFRLLMPVVAGLALGGPLALRIFAPASFHTDQLTDVLVIVVLSTLGWCAALPNIQVLLSEGRSGLSGLAMTIAAALNVGLNIVLVPHLGIEGSALATLASYLTLAAATELLRRPLLHLRPPSLSVLAGLAAVSGLAVASYFIPLHLVGVIGRLAGSAACVAWLLLSLRRLMARPRPVAKAEPGLVEAPP